MGIDTIDPSYYTVADGDGQTTAAREAGVDVGGDPGSAAECRASVLRATESDSRPARLRRIRRGPVRAVLRGRGTPRAAPGPLLPVVADWLFRRIGRGARHCLACGGFVCIARVSRARDARGAARPFDDLPHAAVDRSRDARGRLQLDAAATRRCGAGQGPD